MNPIIKKCRKLVELEGWNEPPSYWKIVSEVLLPTIEMLENELIEYKKTRCKS